jgi:hypothetical protein
LTIQQMKEAIPRLARRLQELEAVKIDRWDDRKKVELDALHRKLDETLVDILGVDTIEYRRYGVVPFSSYLVVRFNRATSPEEWAEAYRRAVADAAAKLRTAIEMFQEKLADLGETSAGRALRAYDGMELHAEIARVVGKLYRDGHYANAVEDAVKVLNALVRMRRGEPRRLEADGTRVQPEQPCAPVQ